MANVKKSARVQNEDILRFTLSGISNKLIGELLGCHAATVSNRLEAMNVSSFDTRRHFMDKVISQLTASEQAWFMDHLYHHELPVQDFLAQLIKQRYHDEEAMVVAPAEKVTPGPQLVDPKLLQSVETDANEVPTVEPELLKEESPKTAA